jgi:DNA-binding NtrC family response regulator
MSSHGMETATAQHTILMVEDEVLIRMSAVAMLEDAGFEVLEAGSSAEALKVLSQHEDVGVLMTDVRLPGDMDGLDLVTRVQRFYPDILSLVVSGNASAAQAQDAGATGFLRKPYMAHSLVRAVTDLFRRQPAPTKTAA